jgi:hypothetical protein
MELFGVLRCAQDDGKNSKEQPQQHEQLQQQEQLQQKEQSQG